MIIDNQNLFSKAQAITATAVSTKEIDLGPVLTLPGQDVNEGNIDVFVQVVETFATLTSLKVSLQGSVDAAFTSPVTLLETAAIAAASLVAGYKFALDGLGKIPYRYVRLNYTVAGSNATAGKVTAGLLGMAK